MRDQHAWDAYRVALGDRLRAARLQANLTQQGLADSADVSRAVIQRIEQGVGSPGLRQLWQLAGALGLRPDDLMRTDDVAR